MKLARKKAMKSATRKAVKPFLWRLGSGTGWYPGVESSFGAESSFGIESSFGAESSFGVGSYLEAGPDRSLGSNP